MNASIEAARAGEHGRGFAVVADEVSKLADRSASSTKEIEGLIKQSDKNVSEGSKLIGNLASALQESIAAIKNINEMSESIAAATEEQSSNSKEVSQAIENVNDITQQASSASEEMAASAEQFTGIAQELLVLIARQINLDVKGGRSSRKNKQGNEKRPVKAIAGPIKERKYKTAKSVREEGAIVEFEKDVTAITLKEPA